MEEVVKNRPWTFDNQLLILERVQIGVQIENIPLYHADFWVQIHDLPTGLMKENVGIQLGNYIGELMEYDKKNNSCYWRQYMRLHIMMDVRVPLKKETRVKDRNGNWCLVRFKYEKLGIFCFVCGVMGHAENRCETRFPMEVDDGRRGWSNDLRAEPRRVAGRPKSRWLVEERGGGSSSRGVGGGGSNGQRQNSGESSRQGPTSVTASNNDIINVNHNSHKNSIIPSQKVAVHHSIPIISQSVHHNGAAVTNPITLSPIENTSTTTPIIKQQLLSSNIVFNAPATHNNLPATSAKQHVSQSKKLSILIPLQSTH
jgi:14-3-3 protein epsilon